MELSTAEGKALIDQIAALQVPVFVLTGGDPIKRPDLFELIAHARQAGVRVSLTPSATPLLTRDIVFRLKQAGLARLAVSMDGASASTHDAFRGLSGSFARTLDCGALGQRSRSAGPDQHHLQPQEYRRNRRHRRTDGTTENHALERLLPRSHRPRQAQRPAERRRIRTGVREDLRALAHCSLRHQDHRGAALSPLSAAAARRRTPRRQCACRAAKSWRTPSAAPREASTTAKASSSSPTPARSFPADSCRSPPAIFAESRSPKSTATSPLFLGLRNPLKLEGKCGACEFK